MPLPAHGGPCVLIDAGANSESKPENLRQFGVMGAMFAEEVLGVESPRVGLLSIGEEASKGTPEVVEAHALLAASGLNFGGNCEGRDALSGEFQVVVADGFAGNVLLKGLEGAGAMLIARAAARPPARACGRSWAACCCCRRCAGMRDASTPRPTAAPTCWACAASP